MNLQYLGLVAVCLLFSTGAFIIGKWPLGKHVTVSQHVAANRYLTWAFVLLSSIFLSLFLPFLFYWFMPTFKISMWFGILIIISSVAQYASALIPEVGGWKTKLHRFLAGVTGLLLIPAIVILLMTNTVSLAGKITTWVSLGVMITIATLLLRGNGSHSHFLALEFGYFGAFFIPILLIAYT